MNVERWVRKQRVTHLLMNEVSIHELQLPSSSHEHRSSRGAAPRKNGWTLGKQAIIEENSRHYNSLVCPFALCPYSSCFISTTFLLLLHDTSSPSNCTPRCYAQFCPVFIQRSIVKMVMSQSWMPKIILYIQLWYQYKWFHFFKSIFVMCS